MSFDPRALEDYPLKVGQGAKEPFITNGDTIDSFEVDIREMRRRYEAQLKDDTKNRIPIFERPSTLSIEPDELFFGTGGSFLSSLNGLQLDEKDLKDADGWLAKQTIPGFVYSQFPVSIIFPDSSRDLNIQQSSWLDKHFRGKIGGTISIKNHCHPGIDNALEMHRTATNKKIPDDLKNLPEYLREFLRSDKGKEETKLHVGDILEPYVEFQIQNKHDITDPKFWDIYKETLPEGYRETKKYIVRLRKKKTNISKKIEKYYDDWVDRSHRLNRIGFIQDISSMIMRLYQVKTFRVESVQNGGEFGSDVELSFM